MKKIIVTFSTTFCIYSIINTHKFYNQIEISHFYNLCNPSYFQNISLFENPEKKKKHISMKINQQNLIVSEFSIYIEENIT